MRRRGVPITHLRYLRLHRQEPDYRRPVLEPAQEARERILGLLERLYGEDAQASLPEIIRLMQVYYAHKTPEMIREDGDFDPAERFTEEDVILITYGDLIQEDDKPPLRALADVLDREENFGINTVHILPFYPYSSDRGFAVTDYLEVDPRLGYWEDIEELGLRFRLMFDGVFNHVSSKSRWFREFLDGNPAYKDYFIRFHTRSAIPDDYLRLILRPRTSELLTGFDTLRGRQYVWTTFGPDHVDLNYQNPEVLLRIVKVLLEYVRRGADIIRIDAVTYIWQELGTRSALLEESHLLVQLFRAILDVVAPQVALVTESNVPHEDNLSYLGDGYNEAQMVYNFALPPLVLQAFQTGDSSRLAKWAEELRPVSEQATFFNFLDSHDGIGLLPVQDILSQEEIARMIETARKKGALISYRDSGVGEPMPYEINTTWFSALNGQGTGEPVERQVDRFIASRSIALILQGVPGIYLPSLVGTANDTEAVLGGEEARSINRGTLRLDELREKLADSESAAARIFCRFGEMIRKRVVQPAFHPNAEQTVLRLDRRVFAVRRRRTAEDEPLVCLVDVGGLGARVRLDSDQLGFAAGDWTDLLEGKEFRVEGGRLNLTLESYEVLWLRPARKPAKSS